MTLHPRTCPETGATFTPTKPWQIFSTRAAAQAFHDRNATRGKALLPLAMVWRRGKRGSTAATRYALAEMARLLDGWREEDEKAGRRPDLVVAAKMGSGWTAADLIARKPRAKAT